MNLRNRGLTDRIISAAIRVHRDLGPGFLENIYEEDRLLLNAFVGSFPLKMHSKMLHCKPSVPFFLLS